MFHYGNVNLFFGDVQIWPVLYLFPSLGLSYIWVAGDDTRVVPKPRFPPYPWLLRHIIPWPHFQTTRANLDC